MKYIVSVSGGKDSTACLLHMLENAPKEQVLPVFLDTKWEHELTYEYLDYLEDKLELKILRIESEGMENYTKRVKCLPNSFKRFCTKELKTRPFHTWLKNFDDDFIVVEGIRREESISRSEAEVFEVKESYFFKDLSVPTIRPIVDWTKKEVIDYIQAKGIKLNPLYEKGYSRVGCFPCVFWNKYDLLLFANEDKYLKRMRDLELKVSKLIGKKVKFFEERRDKFLRIKSLFKEVV